MSNDNNYSGLLGRKTASGGTWGGMIKEGKDGKFKLFYNKPSESDPVEGDRENALVLMDDPIARFEQLASFFGIGGRFKEHFIEKAKNTPSYINALTHEYTDSRTNPNIRRELTNPLSGQELIVDDMKDAYDKRGNWKIDFSKPK